MTFKLDENLPKDLKSLVVAAGFIADIVFDEKLEGSPDQELFTACLEDNRILITPDLDFSNTVQYPIANTPGRIVLRPRTQSKKAIIELFERWIPFLKTESPQISGKIWILEDKQVRIRGG